MQMVDNIQSFALCNSAHLRLAHKSDPTAFAAYARIFEGPRQRVELYAPVMLLFWPFTFKLSMSGRTSPFKYACVVGTLRWVGLSSTFSYPLGFVCLFLLEKNDAHAKSVAPPVSTASISASGMGALRKRAGRSLRSKTSPLAG